VLPPLLILTLTYDLDFHSPATTDTQCKKNQGRRSCGLEVKSGNEKKTTGRKLRGIYCSFLASAVCGNSSTLKGADRLRVRTDVAAG